MPRTSGAASDATVTVSLNALLSQLSTHVRQWLTAELVLTRLEAGLFARHLLWAVITALVALALLLTAVVMAAQTGVVLLVANGFGPAAAGLIVVGALCLLSLLAARLFIALLFRRWQPASAVFRWVAGSGPGTDRHASA